MNAIASLPMYDWPKLHRQTRQWWQVLARNFAAEGLAGVPEMLNGHDCPRDDWRHAQLFMSQTCGYPLRHEFFDALEVIAVPRYKAEGCTGSDYSSMVVARKGDRHLDLRDFGGRCAAYNAEDSQSGYSSLRAVIAPLAQGRPFFSRVVKTGAHLSSMAAVAEKTADICAIDAVAWGLAKRFFPELVAALCVIAQTPPAPATPYVTIKSCSGEHLCALRRGLLKSAEDAEHKELRAHLLLDGFEVLPVSIYERIDAIEKAAVDAGYPVLR